VFDVTLILFICCSAPTRPLGAAAELLLEASFEDMRYGDDGDLLIQAYLELLEQRAELNKIWWPSWNTTMLLVKRYLYHGTDWTTRSFRIQNGERNAWQPSQSYAFVGLWQLGKCYSLNRAYHQLEGIPSVFRNSAGPRFRFFF
jgi:hypothetical protein